jgi:hypothetical protein
MTLGAIDHLTEPQSQFAREHNATPLLQFSPTNGSVFMYRSTDRQTHRWLVDPLGRTVESASFQR